MSILIFACYYHPHIGGYELNIHSLAKRLVVRGHKVTIITSNATNSAASDELDGVQIVRLPAWNALNGTFPIVKPSRATLRLLLKRNPPDVVVTQTRFFTTSMLGTLFAKLQRKPLIHVERGSCHSDVTSKVISTIAKVVDHTVGRWIVRSAKVNVGVSQAACEFILHIGGREELVIRNGVEKRSRSKRSKAGDPLTIVFMGRLVYGKGVQDLIEAFGRCQTENLSLHIIGDGCYRGELEAQAQRTSCARNVHFHGELAHDDALKVLANGDIFVNPSHSEGLPTSVMEAASVGMPIIATDVGGTYEIVEDGVSGIIVQPHDVEALTQAVCELTRDRSRASILGWEAKRQVRLKFDWGKITGQWEELLKGACNGK